MTPVRFSVIIPVHDQSTLIKRAIDSVLAQSWPAHEVIVVDDGSTDAVLKAVRTYGEQVKYIWQPHAGVSAARNHGGESATGDWLAFLDADDWYYPDRLRRHADWIVRDPRLDFLTGDYDYRRPDSSRISSSMETRVSGRTMLAKAAGASEVIMTPADMELFVADHFGDTHTLSVPRRTFLALGGYPAGYRICEDVFFLVKLCAVSRRVGVVCVPTAAYLIHENSAIRRDRLQAQFDNVRTLVALRAVARDFPAPVRRGVRTRLRHGRLNLGHALVRAGRRFGAMRVVLPILWENTGLGAVRDLLSMARGCPREPRRQAETRRSSPLNDGTAERPGQPSSEA